MTLEELNVFVTTQSNVGMEAYYWWCTALMVIIHVGFLMYEVGATRMQNAVSSGVKNLLAFAFMIPTFWLFGFPRRICSYRFRRIWSSMECINGSNVK